MSKKKILFLKPAADPTIDRYVDDLRTRLPKAQFEIVSSFAAKPDIVHLSDDSAGWRLALKARIARVPKIVLTSHFSNSGFKSWLTALCCHRVIVLSTGAKIKLSRWPLIKNKIVVMPRGAPTPEFFSQKAAREYIERELGSTNVCWIGFAKTIEQNPTFLPYLKAFEIIILEPTEIECPYLGLIAGAAGRAVIAIGHAGYRELITNMETGILVRPNNQKELTDAMRYLAENPEKGALFGRNLRKRVERFFSTKTMVRKTIDVYNE